VQVRVLVPRLIAPAVAMVLIALAPVDAAAHPVAPPDYVAIPPPEPQPILAEPARHTAYEAQIGGGVGRYAASNEQWLAFSLGWHQVRRRDGWLLGNEWGLDVDLRLGHARDGASIVIGARPIVRRQDGDFRTAALIGLIVPEVAWSMGDGRQRALRVEWSCPVAIAIHGTRGLEWDVVRGGVDVAGDGVHASIGTELRFLLR
jgi:hypothetical protein